MSELIKQDIKTRLISICDRITTFLDWDMEREQKEYEETSRRNITMSENLRKTVYKAKIEANVNIDLGISTLYDRIEQPSGWGFGWVNLFGYEHASDFTMEEIEKQKTFALIIFDLVQLYTDWKSDNFDPMISNIASTANIKEDEVKIDSKIIEAVNDLVFKERFKAYKYRDTGEIIHSTDTYYMSSIIGFSSDLTLWFDHIQKQEEFLKNQNSDKIFVTMFGKLDEVHPLFSSWIVTMHKGGTIWIITDQIDFDNPYQKRIRANRIGIWEDYGELYSDCDLPYDLFHDIDKLKGANDSLSKNDAFIRETFDLKLSWTKGYVEQYNEFDKKFKEKLDKLNVEYDVVVPNTEGSGTFTEIIGGYARYKGNTAAYWDSKVSQIIIYRHPEFFFKSFDILKAQQKIFTVLLVKEMIQYLSMSNITSDRILLANEYVNQKLLDCASIDASEPVHMKYWNDKSKEVFNELLETLEDGEAKTTALSLHTFDMVIKSKHYNASWLTTPEKLDSLSEWSVLEDERAQLQQKAQILADTKDDADQWLSKKLYDNYSSVVNRMTLAKNITFKTNVFDTFETESTFDGGGTVRPYSDESKSYQSKGLGIGKTKYQEENCLCCNKNRSKKVKQIHIRHYRELMWLVNAKDRSELPKYFRQYRSHTMIPYSGNYILQQTHPYLRLDDPCSKNKPNGIKIELFMCGVCYNKIKQPDNLEIVY